MPSFVFKIISLFLILLQMAFSNLFNFENSVQYYTINEDVQYQTLESFGTSTCWWAQHIDDPKLADNIAKALFSDEEGLGLDVVRYNVGAGERENPNSRIWIQERKTESFYVYDEESGEYKYDFSRDANARRILDLAIKYGAKEVVLFCNSPHYSMTVSGQASGGLEKYQSNLPKENYQAFVDYLLTIADWFVEQGYPVTYISPVNEPMWEWGGSSVSQEGCHYTSSEATELLALFAETMQERNTPYKLSGVESGELSVLQLDYLFKYFENDTINKYCDTFSGHSYWLDGSKAEKALFGELFASMYPDKTFEMTEWCELPQTINEYTNDSALYMANIIVEDLSLLNAVSWQNWTAVNHDGLLYAKGSDVGMYNRYYAFKHFSSFINPGMKRIEVSDTFGHQEELEEVAFSDGDTTVLVVVNNAETPKDIVMLHDFAEAEVYLTDESHSCEMINGKLTNHRYTLPERSITTFVFSK